MHSVQQFGLAFLVCLSLMLLGAPWAYGGSGGEGADSRENGGTCTDQQYDCARYEGDDSTPARSDYPDYPANDVEVLSDPEPVADTGFSGDSSPPIGGIDSGGGAMANTSTSTGVVAFATLSGVFALAALASAVARRLLS
jgi:hypothetical protein